jgi:hypothetical protein
MQTANGVREQNTRAGRVEILNRFRRIFSSAVRSSSDKERGERRQRVPSSSASSLPLSNSMRLKTAERVGPSAAPPAEAAPPSARTPRQTAMSALTTAASEPTPSMMTEPSTRRICSR